MLWGGHEGGLELRKRASGALSLHGRFPYGKRAVLSDGGRTGRPRKEVIAPRAFSYRVERPEEAVDFLFHGGVSRPARQPFLGRDEKRSAWVGAPFRDRRWVAATAARPSD